MHQWGEVDQFQCYDHAKWVLGLALCKHTQQRKIYLFLIKGKLSRVGVDYLSVVENNGIGCRVYRELNFALAHEVGACET